MITAAPGIAAASIWRLADEHGTIVARCTVRTYLVSRRAAVEGRRDHLRRARASPARQQKTGQASIGDTNTSKR
jgi:hypothetical protein